MNINIDVLVLGEQQFEHAVTDGITEASVLGLPVGAWPRTLRVGIVQTSPRWTREETLLVGRGEFGGYYYRKVGSDVRLIVLND